MAIEHTDGRLAADGLSTRQPPTFKREIRIVVFAGLLIWLVIGSVVAVIGKREWDGTMDVVQSTATTVSRLLAGQSDQLLLNADLIRDHAERIVGDADPFGVDRATYDDLVQLISRSTAIVSIWVGDAAGNAVLTTREFPAPRLNAGDRAYFTTVRDDPDRLFIGNLIDTQYPAEALLINTSRRLSQADGTMRGFIQISLDPATISRTFQQVEIGFDASLWWIGPEGQALIREPALPPEQLDDQMPPGAADWPKNWSNDRAYTIPSADVLNVESGVDGKERMFFWSDAPLYGSRIVVGVSRAAMEARWLAQMMWITAFALVVGMASMVILWLLYRSRARNQAYATMLENDVRDRTRDLAMAIEQKDVTMQELSHRVRNAFATILALTRLMLRSSDTIEDFRDDFPARLEALARCHLVLVDAKVRNKAQIVDLVQASLAPYRNDSTRIDIAGPEVELSSNATLGVGLVLHELVTNAVKYGSLSAPDGAISVHWEPQDDGIRLIWLETGGPVVVPPTGSGSGTMIIDRAAAMFGGSFARDFAADGVRAELMIPPPPVS
ncbi:HWE histidine kinase domain-containing protein [Yoonia vestfoldensis]|uniref:HWE histidine kinase domain-containing protein n=1 Tax=Yoonia vestfoldensis TaxID=245188 RepID=UPI00036C224A|nr:HWE histidine kinase domain-containing protein [Yoonia vestfoldensis]